VCVPARWGPRGRGLWENSHAAAAATAAAATAAAAAAAADDDDDDDDGAQPAATKRGNRARRDFLLSRSTGVFQRHREKRIIRHVREKIPGRWPAEIARPTLIPFPFAKR